VIVGAVLVLEEEIEAVEPKVAVATEVVAVASEIGAAVEEGIRGEIGIEEEDSTTQEGDTVSAEVVDGLVTKTVTRDETSEEVVVVGMAAVEEITMVEEITAVEEQGMEVVTVVIEVAPILVSGSRGIDRLMKSLKHRLLLI